MLQDQEGLLSTKTPLAFTDGTAVYKKFAKEYVVHKKGYFILAPSGVGKSFFVRGQKKGAKHWIDADRLWRKAKAMPKGAWWEESGELCDQVDQQCDIVTVQAKKLGLWLMGASSNWLRPDAVVVPHWKTHVKYIKKRELNYDGGITSDRLPQLLRHRRWIMQWVKKGVPRFDSVEESVEYINKLYKKNLKK